MNTDPQTFPALVIGGPTASGKTSAAIEIAEACHGEVVSADAFQLYSGLPILTAQPSSAELARVRHHLIGELGLAESMDVQRYLGMAQAAIREVRGRGRLPIVVGGTGLYIRALLFGLARGLPGPDVDLRQELERRPMHELQEDLRRLDPESAQTLDLKNPRRVIRALEVCLQTGRPFSSFRHLTAWEGAPLGIWIARERGELRERIQQRTNTMFEDGVLEEVREAGEVGSTAAQVIGYRTLRLVLNGSLSRAAGEEAISIATRQYAKRQETWFRKEQALRAVGPTDAVAEGIKLIQTERR